MTQEPVTTETSTDTTTVGPLPLRAGEWELDPFHSAVGFSIRHLGVSKVRGRFSRFTAGLVVGERIADLAVTARIELDSLDTGNPDRDAHVRSADLLDVAARPTMSFRSTRIAGADSEWTMVGDLTIGEVTREVSLDVEFGGAQDFVRDQRTHAGFEATGAIRRSEFGLTFAPGLLGDQVAITLDMQFVGPA